MLENLINLIQPGVYSFCTLLCTVHNVQPQLSYGVLSVHCPINVDCNVDFHFFEKFLA